MDAEEREERKPKRRASEAGIDVPESAVGSIVDGKIGETKSRQHLGNTPCHLVFDKLRKQNTLHEI